MVVAYPHIQTSDAVKFPITERPLPTPTKPAPPPPVPYPHSRAQPRPPYLPFRRISLPSPPPQIHTDRTSLISVGSVEAHVEDRTNRLSVHNGDSPVQGARRRSRARRESSVKPDARLGQDDLKAIAKRQKIIEEFFETEKAYVDGLELVYSHFLTPIISSLDDPEPLLNRSVLTSIFSNFIDIWNLHRSFFTSLSSLLVVPSSSSPPSIPSSSPPRPLTLHNPAPPLSPLLLSHFPYLSLYTPFITSFPSTIQSLTELTSPPTSVRANAQYNAKFSTFLAERERDPKCGRLKLRDWLLTIVQRCPRYLMLIRDLMSCTPVDEGGEAKGLDSVLKLVTKITESLNTSLQTHAQTLSLISLQKSCPNLPASFHLVSPGRTLVKRGELVQVESKEKAGEERREVLLFNDCLAWFARGGGVIDKVGLGEWDWDWDWGWTSGSGSGSASTPTSATQTPSSSKLVTSNTNGSSGPSTPTRPGLTRSRSRSEAQLAAAASARFSSPSFSSPLSTSSSGITSSTPSTPAPPPRPSKRRSMYGFGTPMPGSPLSQSHINTNAQAKMKTPDPPMLRRSMVAGSTPTGSGASGGSGGSSASNDDKWIFKGKIDLVNLDVVIGGGTVLEDEDRAVRRFEVLSPEGSFVLYAESQASRDEWSNLIRTSKSQVMSSINMSNPYSTLSSSNSKDHVRRALVALPYEWGDERLEGSLRGLIKGKGSKDVITKKTKGKSRSEEEDLGESTAATLSADVNKHKKPSERRRKIDHYVPAIWIPDRDDTTVGFVGGVFVTFFITDAHAKDEAELAASSKPARACDACYDAVFPVVDSSEGEDGVDGVSRVSRSQGSNIDINSTREGNTHSNAAGSEVLPPLSHDAETPDRIPTTTKATSTIGTIGSLMDLNMSLSLPSWLSVPSMMTSSPTGIATNGKSPKRGVEGSLALMAIDVDGAEAKVGRRISRNADETYNGSRGEAVETGNKGSDALENGSLRGLPGGLDAPFALQPPSAPRDLEREKRTRIRLGKSSTSSSSHLKIRSYQAILDDFKAMDGIAGDGQDAADLPDRHDFRDGEASSRRVDENHDLDEDESERHETTRSGDGSGGSVSEVGGWETEDGESVHRLESGDIKAPSDLRYSTPPPKSRSTALPSSSNHPYYYYNAYSPSSSRYSLASATSPTSVVSSSPVSPRRVAHNLQRPQRREDTARRSKRFSLPAIGVHAASVTAHTSGSGSAVDSPGSAGLAHRNGPNSVTPTRLSSPGETSSPLSARKTPSGGNGPSKRFSLVLVGRNSRYDLTSGEVVHPGEDSSKLRFGMNGRNDDDDQATLEKDLNMSASPSHVDLGMGLAAAKLSELLERSRSQAKE
ncbi:hypothetical protein CVT24_000709 [Panaeolus cyanescens]|uniref:DH domain-containing protein n=1 Tax=Panaeolus cyanescens TaxID=181874 RepID=A0A409YT32_9AGAR|nr:hypothetical protein CVT24_000709 [Panaeolus cyanescens]